MIKISKSVIAALAVSALVVGISDCKKKGTPAEDVGREIDQAVDKAGQKINTAVDKAGQKIEKAGQKMKNVAKDSKK
ncbi:MAG: hypothetical protein A2W19_07720 [Spirochaetes bacterium RBG_16_49_21]|nr:MAG: hypothetical protein A2W19_07720 [Spirochaetes bacterium RBG_16_49_21]